MKHQRLNLITTGKQDIVAPIHIHYYMEADLKCPVYFPLSYDASLRKSY